MKFVKSKFILSITWTGYLVARTGLGWISNAWFSAIGFIDANSSILYLPSSATDFCAFTPLSIWIPFAVC